MKSLSGGSGESPRVSARLAEPLNRWLTAYAKRHGIDRSEALRRILTDAQERDQRGR